MLGIISSFDVLCGNATYSSALADSLEKNGHDVRRIKLSTRLQKEDCKKVKTKILKELHECKNINIQFELGLYGSTPLNSAKFLATIIKKIPSYSSITIHRIAYVKLSFLGQIKNEIAGLGLMNGLIFFAKNWCQNVYLNHSYRLVCKEIVRQRITKKIRIITHTHSDQQILKNYYGIDSIMHPIMWPENFLNTEHKERNSSVSEQIKIGIFGFLSKHKNYLLVIETFALLEKRKLLGDNPILYIYGGHHPEGPGYGGPYYKTSKNYIKLISDLIERHDLVDNVVWKVAPSDSEMAQKINEVDIVCIPYCETGQSGSGITSQAIQFAKHIVMSDTKMTVEYQKLCDGKIIVFDTQSIISCASAIIFALNQVITPKFKSEFSYNKILDLMTFKEI